MSDAVARPVGFTGFVVRERYSRIECEEPGYEGFWAEVRTNLRHLDRDEMIVAFAEIQQRGQDRFRETIAKSKAVDEAVQNATTDKARAAALKARSEYIASQAKFGAETRIARFSVVAPYIRAWNVYDDQYQAVPPPCVDAANALSWIDPFMSDWLVEQCEQGWRGGKGVRPTSMRSSDAPEPTNEQPPASATAA